MTVKCDFCDNSENETEANLIKLGWLFFDVTHTLDGSVVKFHGVGCSKHTNELLAKFDLLMSKNSLNDGG